MDRLREGAPDTRNLLANIDKQRVCPGRSPAWANRSNSRNGRVNTSAPQQRPDWESCESQFVTLAIDFCLRRAFTGPPGTTDCGIDLRPTKRTAFAKSRTEDISLGYIQLRRRQPLSTERRFPDKVNKRKFTVTVHFVHCESASKGSKWISSSQMTTVLPDFCSALP